MKLTESEKKAFALLIAKYPDDGTDWDGIHDEVARHMLKTHDKAEKWNNLIDSFTYDFNPIDDIGEVARQFIDNEIRTTHKLYQENKELKEKVERLRLYHDDMFEIQNGSPRDIWASIWNILNQPKIPQWDLEEWPALKDQEMGKNNGS